MRFQIPARVITLFSSLTLLILSGCASSPVVEKPDWVHEPGEGAVGSSKTHVKGRHYQEELAIARARERLAARYGVEISSVQNIDEKVINDRSYVTSVKQVEQAVKNQTVKAHVRAVWYDHQQDEIWAWVFPVE